MNYFITGNHTDAGKTVVSSIVTQALMADYWKPVQAGAPHPENPGLSTDTLDVAKLVHFPGFVQHPEAYRLKAPRSPHASAPMENVEIELDKIILPETTNDLVIEGAGGILVPLNDQDFVIDLASKFSCEIILVVGVYLGCINHTLLTYESLKSRGLKVKGLVFNGPSDPEAEDIILKHTGYTCLLRVAQEAVVTPQVIEKYATQLGTDWIED